MRKTGSRCRRVHRRILRPPQGPHRQVAPVRLVTSCGACTFTALGKADDSRSPRRVTPPELPEPVTPRQAACQPSGPPTRRPARTAAPARNGRSPNTAPRHVARGPQVTAARVPAGPGRADRVDPVSAPSHSREARPVSAYVRLLPTWGTPTARIHALSHHVRSLSGHPLALSNCIRSEVRFSMTVWLRAQVYL